MSFARYPAYKDSGVEWLGEVPCEWAVERFDKHTYTHRTSITPDQLVEQVVLHYSIPSIQETGYGSVEEGASIDSNKLVVSQPQLLVSKLNPHKQVVVFAKPHDELLTVSSTEFVPLVPTTANSDYITYVWQSSTCLDYLLARCDSATRSHQRVSPDDISKMLWCWPSETEQIAIATFLDHETAKIDALVAEQERLIELLKEKRQAVITHVVTKGLDPSVPMKESGVDWLGEVPAHWEVRPLRRVISAIEQGWSPECYAREAEEQEWGVLKAGCVNGGTYRPAENKALPPELEPEESYEVRAGDVLMSRASGSPELVGSTALVNTTRPRLMLSDKIFRLKLREVVSAPFFVAALNSRALRIQIENALSGGNGMANNLPQSSLLTFQMATPPLSEQAAITVFLDQEIPRIEALMNEGALSIELLRERRTALISAAVTGQIDVRELASKMATT